MTKSASSRSTSPAKRKTNQKKQPEWWEQIDSPITYAICAIFAIAVFYDFNTEDSIVYRGMMSLRESLIDLGGEGLRAMLKRTINFESETTKWTICILALILNAIALRHLWLWINRHGPQQEEEAATAKETKECTPRLTPQAYEF